MILVLCTLYDDALSLQKVSRKDLELSQDYGVDMTSILKIINGHNSAKSKDGFMALFLCTLPVSVVALYLFKDYI